MKYLFLFRLFLVLYTISNFILSLQFTKETKTCTSYKNKKKCIANRDCTWMTKCQLKLPVTVEKKFEAETQPYTMNTHTAIAYPIKPMEMVPVMIID